MKNPLILPILTYLKAQHSACSLIDLMTLCQQDFTALIEINTDPQIVIFQKNFFLMNALYQIQEDIQREGFLLSISPLQIYIVAMSETITQELTTGVNKLAQYYLDWTNLDSITVADIETLFTRFWQKYSAVDDVSAALVTLELLDSARKKQLAWLDIRKAYHKKIALTHPDKGGCAAEFIEVRQAYEVLSGHYRKA